MSHLYCAHSVPSPLLYMYIYIHNKAFLGSIVRCRSAEIKLGASMEIFPPTSPAIMVHGGCEVQVISNTATSVICQHPSMLQERGETLLLAGRVFQLALFLFLCVCEVSQGVETTSMLTHLPSVSPFCVCGAERVALFFLLANRFSILHRAPAAVKPFGADDKCE